MKFHVPQKELSNVLNRCAAIASKRSTSMPILSHVMLTPGESCLKVHATDLEIGFSAAIDGLVWDEERSESSILLPAKTLNECVKLIPSGEVVFYISDCTAKITGGTVSFTLSGLDASEYPTAAIEQGEELTIDISKLVKTIKHVAYCQSTDETKHTLNGSFLQLEHDLEGELFAVLSATDGHRLCLDTEGVFIGSDEDVRVPQEIPAALLKGVIVPAKGIAELTKLSCSDPAVLGVVGNTLYVSLGDERLSIQLVEGEFPPVARVIPQNPIHTIILNRSPLLDALERCRVLTNKESRRINLMPANGVVGVSTAQPQIGAEANDHVTAEFTDDPPAMAFNVDYMMQALSNISSNQIEIKITDALSPIIINPVGSDFPQAIVMPMRAE
jgi:DNA polymerase-3 subunit beta